MHEILIPVRILVNYMLRRETRFVHAISDGRQDFDQSHPADSGPGHDGHKMVFNAATVEQMSSRTYEIRILDLDSRQVTVVPGSLGLWGPRWSPERPISYY
jgi:hypothetical protein